MAYKKQKKRKAVRKSEVDPDGEMDMPVMKTSELAAQHVASVKTGKYARLRTLNEIGTNEEGKELFDDIFKAMASPDNQSD